ncbi:hypothetical protein NQ318_016682 [Aromia moschata]|uniref:DUF3456 domain-containing protein n=1 Tax=Aromia moschata TaxID=1265417 RepID=A0AAV8Y2U0_9CUCU|nr:hypothetical protein NQ318_016682 [Aromia moschata]
MYFLHSIFTVFALFLFTSVYTETEEDHGVKYADKCEDGVCDRILQYNIHKEREDSTRFAKGMSETFRTLHGLVDKGVKVELGIPYELWDKPSAEITNMKTQCETLLEEHEADIEDWYFKHQGKLMLKKYLCEDRALKNGNSKCLHEELKGETGKKKPSKKEEL